MAGAVERAEGVVGEVESSEEEPRSSASWNLDGRVL